MPTARVILVTRTDGTDRPLGEKMDPEKTDFKKDKVGTNRRGER